MTNGYKFVEHYGFRAAVVDELTLDLIGPRSEDEVLTEAPLFRYVAGILFPRPPVIAQEAASITDGSADALVDPQEEQDVAESGDKGTTGDDPPVATANVRYPSSMGLTFAVDGSVAEAVEIACTAARYQMEPAEQGDAAAEGEESVAAEAPEEPPGEGSSPPPDGYPVRRGRAPAGERWRRTALGPYVESISLGVPGVVRRTLQPGLELYVRVRSADPSGAVSVTAVLMNTLESTPGTFRDDISYFQARIRVEAPSAGQAFLERPMGSLRASDPDLESYRLIYREARSFAVGHGCSVRWDVADGEQRASAVETTFIPTSEVRLMESNPKIATDALVMHGMATEERSKVLVSLGAVIAGYETWIAEQRARIDGLRADLRPTAGRHMDDCSAAASRMRGGLKVLSEDDLAWRAFQLMNLAMARQRARVAWLRADKKPTPQPPVSEDRWYPFQIGFILLCLDGLTNEVSPEREVADLLWFPTGGGKTEAYLGLIAYRIFIGRLRKEREIEGVTALMRYTLRLLTVQQFERATALICECESLRRGDAALGSEPISIGLWLGKDGTPNTLEGARTSLTQMGRHELPTEGNPVQLQRCAWCGHALDHKNYVISKRPARLLIQCRQDECEFGEGLPAFVVDEDIYSVRPSLLISTVDKFARLPWRRNPWGSDIEALFGHSDGAAALPIQLIIQDELHLISGPLGTLTGLYETAVDALTRRGGAAAKVVASTATIRGASDQVRALFARPFSQFPPPGIDADDSYFAVEAPPERKGSRRYVGVMSPATSHSSLMIRVYASLLQSAQDVLPGASDGVRDTFWTLLGYFNSLRVLASARLQVSDDVKDRLKQLNGAAPRGLHGTTELTSRESTAELPFRLKQMETSFPDVRAFDAILATNMISVGVDIPRLGLMVVMGQPQATAEYIQATSRVGRASPGLVVTVLNSARSRDISHFESFPGYHAALYRQVEASSVTPFSPRARDRGLHAVLIALARLQIPELADVSSAVQILKQPTRASVQEIVEGIVARVSAIDPAAAADTRLELEAIIERWEESARLHGSNLRFQRGFRYNPITKKVSVVVGPSLLIESTDEPSDEGAFPTLRSLRDVDETTNLTL